MTSQVTKRLTFLLVLSLFSLTEAHALVPNNVQPPPARYDYPYKGKLYAYVGGRWLITTHCGPLAYACAPIGGEKPGQCTITLPRVGTWFTQGRIDEAGYRALIRHERAHCNGWPANHPR